MISYESMDFALGSWSIHYFPFSSRLNVLTFVVFYKFIAKNENYLFFTILLFQMCYPANNIFDHQVFVILSSKTL